MLWRNVTGSAFGLAASEATGLANPPDAQIELAASQTMFAILIFIMSPF